MKTKIAAVLAATALAVAGCASPMSEEQVEHSTLPAPSLPATSEQSMTDLLMPPTDAVVPEVPKGSLGVFIEDYAPQPALDTFLNTYLSEGE